MKTKQKERNFIKANISSFNKVIALLYYILCNAFFLTKNINLSVLLKDLGIKNSSNI